VRHAIVGPVQQFLLAHHFVFLQFSLDGKLTVEQLDRTCRNEEDLPRNGVQFVQTAVLAELNVLFDDAQRLHREVREENEFGGETGEQLLLQFVVHLFA